MNWFLACMVWLFIYFYGNVTLTHFNHQCILILMRMCVRDVLVLRVELLWLAGAVLLPSALRWFQVFSYFTVFVLLFSEGAGQWPPAVQVVVPAVPTLDTQIQHSTCGARHCA